MHSVVGILGGHNASKNTFQINVAFTFIYLLMLHLLPIRTDK